MMVKSGELQTMMRGDQSIPRRRSRMTILVTISALSLFLTILFLTGTPWDFQPPHLGLFESQNDQDPAVAESRFLLHPQDHVFREATTLELRWRVTSCQRRPDGVLKQVYCINGQFPGPTIEARSGDRMIIEVENALEDDEGLSIHWHGLWMRGANGMDGAVGITQNPIESGAKFTYEFTVDDEQAGTFWYHAHSGVQRADGLYGGLVVHAPLARDDNYAEDTVEWLVMVSDWYHRSAKDALYFYSHPGAFGNEPVPDSILLNGAGSYECSDAVPARPVDCEFRAIDGLGFSLRQDKRTIVRLVNVGSYAGFAFRMPNAALTPIRVDGGHAVSDEASAHSIGIIAPGQRVELLVAQISTSTVDEVLEVTLDDQPFKYPNSALTLTHQFPITWIGGRRARRSVKQPSEMLDFQSLKASSRSSAPAKEADETLVLYAVTQKMASRDNVPMGFINGTSWKPLGSPALPLVTVSRERWDKNQFVPHIASTTGSPRWVDLVVNNLDEEGHELHLHGYDVWVLSTFSSTYNWGSYNPFEDAEPPGGPYDLERPLKRDTVYIPRRGYTVLRVLFQNPGIWMFHCHTLWHQASGMAMAFEVS